MSNNNNSASKEQGASTLYDPHAEAFAIGWLILHSGEAATLLDKITPGMIWEERHRLIINKIDRIVADGDKPSTLLVAQRIREAGQEHAAGGMPYLSSLPDEAQRMSDQEGQTFENALQLLRGKWTLRSCASIGKFMADAAEAGTALSPQFIQDARDQFEVAIKKAGVERSKLPEIEDCSALLDNPPPKPPLLIGGLLYQTNKMVLGGSSKERKTWTLMDMAHSVATGTRFWGLPTHQGPVLYLNFELQKSFFAERLAEIARAKGAKPEPGLLDHWGLRGYAANIDDLLAELLRRLQERKYVLLIVDPTYKLMGGRDENKAGDIASLLNGFERIAVETGAAVAFAAHFAKGNQSGKESIDRISGSGVYARDPDTITTLTKHEQDGVLVVETTLRNMPPLPPFCVQWDFPLLRRVDLDPAKLKNVTGRPKKHNADDIAKLLSVGGMTTTEWLTVAEEEGIPRSTFYDLRKELVRGNGVIQSAINKKWVPVKSS